MGILGKEGFWANLEIEILASSQTEIDGCKRISRHLSDCGHVERRFHVIIAASRTRIWRQRGLGCRDQRLSIE